ncbi:hypothetical protein NQZ68_022572 [Dissostichus eleginoides]|nr:hypothetical protein NQZ68_022572 [Dissostichus eleginoides]
MISGGNPTRTISTPQELSESALLPPLPSLEYHAASSTPSSGPSVTACAHILGQVSQTAQVRRGSSAAGTSDPGPLSALPQTWSQFQPLKVTCPVKLDLSSLGSTWQGVIFVYVEGVCVI